jgi:proteasome lid subunit RPN8/RPN11
LAGSRHGAVLSAKEAFPLVNQLGSPTRFVSEPDSLFRALKSARGLGLEVVAIYHSHPDGPPVPSRTDLDWRWAPGVADLIVGLSGAVPVGRAWDLHVTPVAELALEIAAR